jgi:hypothetical protein
MDPQLRADVRELLVRAGRWIERELRESDASFAILEDIGAVLARLDAAPEGEAVATTLHAAHQARGVAREPVLCPVCQPEGDAVERVARALWEEARSWPLPSAYQALTQRNFDDLARAVLVALAEGKS